MEITIIFRERRHPSRTLNLPVVPRIGSMIELVKHGDVVVSGFVEAIGYIINVDTWEQEIVVTVA